MSNDLRKLVARTVMASTLGYPPDYWAELTDKTRNLYLVRADAVLAALTEAGALLPEVPKDIRMINTYRRIDGTWCVSTTNITDGRHYAKEVRLHGHGPTIPAAIANALEGAAK